jgi:hypothetical protein
MVDENHPFSIVNFLLPHVMDAKLVVAINHSILRIFQKLRIQIL